MCVCDTVSYTIMLESPKDSNQSYRKGKSGHSDYQLTVMSIYGIPYELAQCH